MVLIADGSVLMVLNGSEPLTCCCVCVSGPGCFLPGQSDSTMSTSDSDYSIDWLASDEDDYDGPKTFSPERVEEPAAPPSPPSPSSSSSALRPPPPPSSLHCAETHRRRRCWRRRRSGGCCCCDCKDGAGCDPPASLQNPAVSPVQGFTSICAPQTLPVASERQAGRKRAHGAGPDGFCGKPPADTENDLFAQKVRRCFLLQSHDGLRRTPPDI